MKKKNFKLKIEGNKLSEKVNDIEEEYSTKLEELEQKLELTIVTLNTAQNREKVKDIEKIHGKESVNKATILKQSLLLLTPRHMKSQKIKTVPQMLLHGVSVFFVIRNLKVKLFH